MAYALSHLHSLIRGSVGGLTYFANQFHQIVMRQRTAPVQPNTAFQVGIRTAFDAAEVHWLSLSEAERDDWRSYALTCTYPGPGGDYTVPGRQLFIGTIALARYADGIEPALLRLAFDAPVISGWLNIGPISTGLYTGETQGIAVVVENGTTEKACAVIDVSIAFNVTRTRYKGPWISLAKTIAMCPTGSTIIPIDRPAGTLDKAVFSRTRVFSANDFGQDAVPHRLAFPAHLRHICAEPLINGNGDDLPGGAAPAKKAAKKNKAKNA